MATQTVVSDPSTTQQEVEKEIQSGVGKTEAEIVTPPTESIEDPKTVETPCEAAASVESEPRVDAKEIEPPVIEAQEPIQQKNDDKPIEVSVPVEEKKTEDIPVVETKSEEPKVEKIEELVAEVVETPKDAPKEAEVECKPEEPSELMPVVEEKLPEKSEVIEQVEKAVLVVEAVEKAETETPKYAPKEAEAECKPDEPLEPVSVVEEKLPEKSEFIELVPEVEALEKADAETPKDIQKEAEAEAKCKPGELLESVPVVEEILPEKSEVVELIEKALPVEKVEAETVVPKEAVEIESSDKVESEKVEPEEKTVVAEDFAKCEENAIEEAKSTIPPPEVVEKEAEVTSRDIEPVAENGNTKEETICEEATKEPEKVESKIEEAVEATEAKVEGKIKEKVEAVEAKLEEVKKVDGKIEEAVKDTEAKLDEEKHIDDSVKTEECTKDVEDNKDQPKEEVPVKTQKPSIVKMVKQSLAKAKKAIFGKNSKTPAPEAKEAC